MKVEDFPSMNLNMSANLCTCSPASNYMSTSWIILFMLASVMVTSLSNTPKVGTKGEFAVIFVTSQQTGWLCPLKFIVFAPADSIIFSSSLVLGDFRSLTAVPKIQCKVSVQALWNLFLSCTGVSTLLSAQLLFPYGRKAVFHQRLAIEIH